MASAATTRERILASARIVWGPGEYGIEEDGAEARVVRDGAVRYRATSLTEERTPLEALDRLLRRAAERSA
jgi:hypothetical protein